MITPTIKDWCMNRGVGKNRLRLLDSTESLRFEASVRLFVHKTLAKGASRSYKRAYMQCYTSIIQANQITLFPKSVQLHVNDYLFQSKELSGRLISRVLGREVGKSGDTDLDEACNGNKHNLLVTMETEWILTVMVTPGRRESLEITPGIELGCEPSSSQH